jgi:hypothetical protein
LQTLDGYGKTVLQSVQRVVIFNDIIIVIIIDVGGFMTKDSFEPSFLPSGIVVETMPLFFYALLSGGFSAGKSVGQERLTADMLSCCVLSGKTAI